MFGAISTAQCAAITGIPGHVLIIEGRGPVRSDAACAEAEGTSGRWPGITVHAPATQLLGRRPGLPPPSSSPRSGVPSGDTGEGLSSLTYSPPPRCCERRACRATTAGSAWARRWLPRPGTAQPGRRTALTRVTRRARYDGQLHTSRTAPHAARRSSSPSQRDASSGASVAMDRSATGRCSRAKRLSTAEGRARRTSSVASRDTAASSTRRVAVRMENWPSEKRGPSDRKWLHSSAVAACVPRGRTARHGSGARAGGPAR